jgi:SAM-dependent methyltransferase
MEDSFDPLINITKDIHLRISARTSLNRLCDISDWRNGGEICIILKSLGECVCIHRKAWEYAYCIYGLTRLGMVNPESKAIAIGAGHERPLYYFANQIAKVVATDLYNDRGTDDDAGMLTTPEKFAPFTYRKENLEVYQMNGTDLKFPENSFDFAFTLSSIEHFGSRENITKAMSEIFRVLKPGGILCLTTELILNNTHHPEYFTFEEFKKYILESTEMKIIGGEIDLRISDSIANNPIDLDVEKDLTISPHIVLKQGNVIWTSIICFLQKPV